MVEQRTYGRFTHGADSKAFIECAGLQEDAPVIDVSAGGMRVMLTQQKPIGEFVAGKLQVIPQIGPFYVQGKVLRVLEKDGRWETAVKFDRVSTLQNMARVA
jgi:hypothetical protein